MKLAKTCDIGNNIDGESYISEACFVVFLVVGESFPKSYVMNAGLDFRINHRRDSEYI